MHDDAGLNGVQPATWSSLMVSDGHLVPLDLMFQTQHLAVAQLKYWLAAVNIYMYRLSERASGAVHSVIDFLCKSLCSFF